MNSLQTEGFQKLTKIEDALRILFGSLGERPVELESVAVSQALGRFLGKDVVAKIYVPPFDRANMDGYAVRAEDVRNASQQTPAALQVVGESKLGEVCKIRVGTGEAVAVATGSIIPSGADTVVIVERTSRLADGKVAVRAPTETGQSIAKKGEDVTPGTIVLRKGTRIRPQDIGILKALSVDKIPVVRKPRVGVLSTGNELVYSASRRSSAKFVDLNGPIISTMLTELGANPVGLGIVRDRESQIMAALRKAVKSCEAVIVTAGSSVGKGDLVPNCIDQLGKPGMLVHGVAMKPAMPTGLAVVDGKPILSFPGFPVSAIIAFRVFARPLIVRMMGARVPADPIVQAVLSERISGAPGSRTFVRVSVKRTQNQFVAEPLKVQRSSVLMSMVDANGIVTVLEDAGAFEAGQTVDVELIGQV